MSKKYWLIIITLIILVVGALCWYLNYQLTKTTFTPSTEETIEETTETEKAGDKTIKSIELEKPPFIKD